MSIVTIATAMAMVADPSDSSATEVTDPSGAPADIPAGSNSKKVLILDLDGVRLDKLREATTPNLDALAAEGLFGPTMTHGTDLAPTVSGPLHSNVLTGVWPNKHRVTDNDIVPNDLAGFPDLLTRLGSIRPDLSTFAVGDWPPLLKLVINTPKVKTLHPYTDAGSKSSALRTLAWAREALTLQDPDVGYVYFIHADAVGHAVGGAASEYRTAIEELDDWVGMLVEAVRERPMYGEEDWLIIVTTDHGHLDAGGHGGDEPEVRQIWTLLHGAGLKPGVSEARMVDLAPTVYAHLGVEIDQAWDLDGTSVL